MGSCTSCSNKDICKKSDVINCDHYDIAFTRSEIINMIMSTDSKNRGILQHAVERAYNLKMAF